MITLKQQRRLRKLVVRQIRLKKQDRLHHYIIKWAKIRKQKDRRRRRTMIKLWKLERLKLMRLGRLPLAS
jgi:hypothetical protein